MDETILDGRSFNITKDNIEKIFELFPEVNTEGKVDFEKLKLILGENIEYDSERYDFTWKGKAQAIRLSQTSSLGTLRPCKEESKDWYTTRNLYIEGDNLEVLKILQKSYYGKVKMIYIDPPYNTGGDFVYKDDFKDSIKNYKEVTGQIDKEGNKLTTNSESSGRYHTNWLNMMYPRLRLARNLLRDDGVIFISIDDNEVENLKKICNEIFGEENFIAHICHKSRASISNDKIISSNHNHILLFAKSQSVIFEMRNNIGLDPVLSSFTLKDDIGYYKLVPVDGPGGATKGNPFYEFRGVSGYWRFSKETMEQKFKEGTIVVRDNSIQQKYYLKDAEKSRKTDNTWWDGDVLTSSATTDLSQIMGGKVFDNPKNINLIKRMLKLFVHNDKNAIILDFFSGSATTAHAVLEHNSENNSEVSFIMVQIPEPCSEKSDAIKFNYVNICEIGKERIRRAGDSVKKNVELENKQRKIDVDLKTIPDIGFRVFKLDSSNIKKWQPDVENLKSTLLGYADNLMPSRTEEDVLYEIIFKMGLDPTSEVKEFTEDGKRIFSIGSGALMVCLDENVFDTSVASRMVKLYNELKPEIWKVVFLDKGFKTDDAKANTKETLKMAGLDDTSFVTL